MKRITIKYMVLVPFIQFIGTSHIRASEPKSLIQDILTNQDNRWKDLHLLPSQLIGSMILHNHPIVLFILNRVLVVSSLNNHLNDHINKNSAMEFMDLGDMVFSASDDRRAKLREVRSGNSFFKGHTSYVESDIFNDLEDMVLTASTDGTAKLWDTRSGKCHHTLKGHTWPLCSAVFNDLGDLVATASRDTTAKLWDASTGECLKTLEGHTSSISSARFNGLGDLVVTASDDTTVKLWDTNSGECLKTLKGHTKRVSSAKFTGSGDVIVTASDDNTAKLWDTNSGQCLKTLMGFTGRVSSAKFTGLGDMIVTTSADGTAKIYDITQFLALRSFFLREDSISLNQALVLIGIYEIIISRSLPKKMESTDKRNFRRLKIASEVPSVSAEEPTMNPDRIFFDFRKYPHLQSDYEKLPQEIQRILDEYVRKTPPKNECSTTSTADKSEFASASTSEDL